MAINVRISPTGNSNIKIGTNTFAPKSVKVGAEHENIEAEVSAPVTNPIRFSTNATPIVIRNDALIAANELRGLLDVELLDESDGNTLVYNAEEEKFILESPNNLNITSIDGGNF